MPTSDRAEARRVIDDAGCYRVLSYKHRQVGASMFALVAHPVRSNEVETNADEERAATLELKAWGLSCTREWSDEQVEARRAGRRAQRGNQRHT